MQRPALISPSLLAADCLRLGEELKEVEAADLIHLDVMDGHFVPNLTFGIDTLRAVKGATGLPVDVHLMISNPDEMVEKYLDAGADIVSFHYEAATHAHRLPDPQARQNDRDHRDHGHGDHPRVHATRPPRPGSLRIGGRPAGPEVLGPLRRRDRLATQTARLMIRVVRRIEHPDPALVLFHVAAPYIPKYSNTETPKTP